MNSKDYWEKRALQRENNTYNETSKTIARLKVIYQKALNQLNKDSDSIFKNYVGKYDGEKDETLKYLTSNESAAVLSDLRKRASLITDSDLKKEVLIRLEAPAYGFRLSRVKAMQNYIIAELNKISDQENQIDGNHLANVYENSYYRNIYDTAPQINASFSMISAQVINETLKSSWLGENYSERVWKNTHVLAQEASDIIQSGITSGRSIKQMQDELADVMDVGKYVAERLIRTETNYFHNQAEMQSYKSMGVEEYIFLATLDSRTCARCGALDKKIFKVSDIIVGVNYPPLHPNDRCVTTANVESAGKRIARDPTTGRNYYVDHNLSYTDWKKQINEKYGSNTLEKAQKMYFNRKSDKENLEKYQAVLGKDAPKALADFQNIKYSSSEEWKKIQLDYRRRNRLVQNSRLALPNAEKAKIDEPKFTNYFFGGNNNDGLSKGIAFNSHLGYNISNWKDFEQEILRKLKVNPATPDRITEHGSYYNQSMILYGVKNNPMDIKFVWEVKNDITRFVTAYPNRSSE
jgi:SPP1 gp7 family putative phage head morphogenesis protein